MEIGTHRPRNIGWARAAALLYGDWGTSKAYVIGLAFVAAAYSSLPIILAVCGLTALVGLNYIIICRHFPDGGGVYSAARSQGHLLAVVGALLLVADLTVTAALSGWSAMIYFGVPKALVGPATMGLILVVGAINYFGPKHSGSFAVSLALPMVVVVITIVGLSIPYLTTVHLEPTHTSFSKNWVAFVGVILALSGVEAIANLTGVLKLDKGATMQKPRVGKTSAMAILIVMVEVVGGTALLGWAMLSLPQSFQPEMNARWEDMLRFLGEKYGALAFGTQFGQAFGIFVGIVVGLLLLSAVNTAIGALIGLLYMTAVEGEMPKGFAKLNRHGVPWIPLLISVSLPILIVLFANNLETLAGLYAIGVVGAITLNLGSCTFNKALDLSWAERGLMGFTFLCLVPVELTIAKTKHDALFFICCVLILGLLMRAYTQRRSGLHTVVVSREVAAAVAPGSSPDFKIDLKPGQTILVAARGLTPLLRFGMEEARLRQATLYVLYVKEVAVTLPGVVESAKRPQWQDDPDAARIMYRMLESGKENGIPVLPIYVVSERPAGIIVDLAATLGVDILVLGSPHRGRLVQLLKGNLVAEVAESLPENIQLIIHS
jgi:amino acid transporter/nucleotide-binding universal stress UspA family protein